MMHYLTLPFIFSFGFLNSKTVGVDVNGGLIIVPPNVATPTVFELKNPNTNIQGRVR